MFGFLAQLLAWCFDLVPNYAVAITLFTLIVMAAITPFTVKGMRSAAEMSRLQPEMKKLQEQYKNDRIKQNEEMQKLFKEHGVNPLGGCLPTLLPLPIFFIIFRLLEGLRARHNGMFAPLVRLLRHQVGGSSGYVAPKYLKWNTTLTQHIIGSNGVMKSFGMNLAATARDHHATVGEAIPFYALIVVMTASQYWQQRQINKRNPAAAQANPQMKLTMQIFPAFYALISLSIPASVVLYLLVSGLFRMAQNAVSYRFDPVLQAASSTEVIDVKSRPSAAPASKGGRAAALAPARSSRAAPAAEAPKKGLFASLREAAEQARTQQEGTRNGNGGRGSSAPAPSRSSPAPAREDAPAAAREETSAASEDAPAPPPAPAPAPVAREESAPARSSSSSPLSVRPSGRVTPPGTGAQRGRKRSKRRG